MDKDSADDGEFPYAVGANLRKNGEIYIYSQSLLRGIAYVQTEPFLRTSLTEDSGQIGYLLLEAKTGSLPFFERENPNQFIPPYFEWAGVKSHSQFAKRTKSVDVKFHPEFIEFIPKRNERGTWFGMPDHIEKISAKSTPEQIGEQLLKSFEVAKA